MVGAQAAPKLPPLIHLSSQLCEVDGEEISLLMFCTGQVACRTNRALQLGDPRQIITGKSAFVIALLMRCVQGAHPGLHDDLESELVCLVGSGVTR